MDLSDRDNFQKDRIEILEVKRASMKNMFIKILTNNTMDDENGKKARMPSQR